MICTEPARSADAPSFTLILYICRDYICRDVQSLVLSRVGFGLVQHGEAGYKKLRFSKSASNSLGQQMRLAKRLDHSRRCGYRGCRWRRETTGSLRPARGF